MTTPPKGSKTSNANDEIDGISDMAPSLEEADAILANFGYEDAKSELAAA